MKWIVFDKHMAHKRAECFCAAPGDGMCLIGNAAIHDSREAALDAYRESEQDARYIAIPVGIPEELKSIDMVREFHNAFGQHVDAKIWDHELTMHEKLYLSGYSNQLRAMSESSNKAAAHTEDVIFMRLHLAMEELAEMCEALAANDPVALLDALTDRQYVLDGDYLTFGMDKVKDEAFAEVHRSNMSKLVNGQPILSETGRVLKPDTYSPADLGPIVKACKQKES